MTKARYIMIGGFLGAGKTTAVARLAQHLSAQGKRVGLITNDQGKGLVDTAMLSSRGFQVEEIAGGCFCCRFNSLLEAARSLTAAMKPDVFIAEPVGSCTDLVATVTYPLRRIYGDEFAIAPLSVLVDAVRAMRVLGLTPGPKFSEKVLYIYRKQLEEADIIVINKADLIDRVDLGRLQDELKKQFPQGKQYVASARKGDGLPEWFEEIAQSEQQPRAVMGVDYQIYADGEALLGWLNATVQFKFAQPTDVNAVIEDLASAVQRRLEVEAVQIAHFKMTFDANHPFGELAAISLVRNDYVPELSQKLTDPVTEGELVINLRAEAGPALLRKAVEQGLFGVATEGMDYKVEDIESFRPGKPVPTHREGINN
jgi:G3E family GTPase